RRLESERRTQNHGECLFVARERAADRFNARDLGRSCELPQEKEREAPRLPVRKGPAAGGKIGRPLCAHRDGETEAAEEVGIVGRLCQTPAPEWRFTETPYNCRTPHD
ncbi:MAG: hypothetical protein QOJ64_2129, partial [Acidobacteriota bacterium]|nr:hypothetical protein [Acidobacteriota bacterium]